MIHGIIHGMIHGQMVEYRCPMVYTSCVCFTVTEQCISSDKPSRNHCFPEICEDSSRREYQIILFVIEYDITVIGLFYIEMMRLNSQMGRKVSLEFGITLR
jgi:hypothetical protein